MEHAQLFILLGAPLLKISAAQPVAVQAPRLVDQGAAVTVEINTPVEGLATVELVAKRGAFTAPLADRTHYDATLKGRREYLETYLRANDQRLDQQQWSVPTGRRTFTMQLPLDFSGPCHARIYINGVHQYALGATELYVQQRKSRQKSAE